MDLKYGIGLSEGEEDARTKALAAIATAASQAIGRRHEPELRPAVGQGSETDKQVSITADASIKRRIEKCDAVLRRYTDDGVFTSLVDLLADAMHWADATGEDFHYILCLACKHYVAELNDEQLEERRLP